MRTLLLHVFLFQVMVDGRLPTCATILVLRCCGREVTAREVLGLGKGNLCSGKGRGCCFSDVHVCVQPRMGIFFFWRSFWVLMELK